MTELITAKKVAIIGRYDMTAPEVKLCWVNSGMEARFVGSGLSLTLDSAMPDGENDTFIQVWTDGVRGARIRTHSGKGDYEAVKGLPFGEHSVRVLTVSECQWNPLTLISLTVEGEGASLLPVRAEKKLKFDCYGDSLTCGMGTLPGCEYMRSCDQDSTLAHAFRTVEHFGGDGEYTAISGWGIMRGWDGMPEFNIPRVWDNASGAGEAKWDVAGRNADIIIVMLGTNDYSHPVNEDDFVSAYKQFFGKLRAAAPTARIFCTAPNEPADVVKRAAEEFSREDAVGAEYVAIPSMREECYKGSNGHPNGSWGADVSAKFVEAIEKVL